jgi:hypothetical protein
MKEPLIYIAEHILILLKINLQILIGEFFMENVVSIGD